MDPATDMYDQVFHMPYIHYTPNIMLLYKEQTRRALARHFQGHQIALVAILYVHNGHQRMSPKLLDDS